MIMGHLLPAGFYGGRSGRKRALLKRENEPAQKPLYRPSARKAFQSKKIRENYEWERFMTGIKEGPTT
jgi:hypothetical protein